MERNVETVELRRHTHHKQRSDNHAEGTSKTKWPNWAKKWCGSRWHSVLYRETKTELNTFQKVLRIK